METIHCGDTDGKARGMLRGCSLPILFAVIFVLALPMSSMATHYLIYGQAQIQYWPQHPTDTIVTVPFANEKIEIRNYLGQHVTDGYTNANGDYNIQWDMGAGYYALWSELTNSYVDITDGVFGNPVSHSFSTTSSYVQPIKKMKVPLTGTAELLAGRVGICALPWALPQQTSWSSTRFSSLHAPGYSSNFWIIC